MKGTTVPRARVERRYRISLERWGIRHGIPVWPSLWRSCAFGLKRRAARALGGSRGSYESGRRWRPARSAQVVPARASRNTEHRRRGVEFGPRSSTPISAMPEVRMITSAPARSDASCPIWIVADQDHSVGVVRQVMHDVEKLVRGCRMLGRRVVREAQVRVGRTRPPKSRGRAVPATRRPGRPGWRAIARRVRPDLGHPRPAAGRCPRRTRTRPTWRSAAG